MIRQMPSLHRTLSSRYAFDTPEMSKSSFCKDWQSPSVCHGSLDDVMSMMCNRRSSNVEAAMIMCAMAVKHALTEGITAAIREDARTLRRCQFDNDCESGLCHHKVKRVIGGIASFGDPSAPVKINENEFAALQDGGYGGGSPRTRVMEMDTATETAKPTKPATRQQL